MKAGNMQIHMVAFLLMAVGGLNWGLVGLFNYNLVTMLFGSYPMVEKLIYIAVGVSSTYILFTHKSDCKTCGRM